MIARVLVQWLKDQIPEIGDRWYFTRTPQGEITRPTGTVEYANDEGMYDLSGEIAAANPRMELKVWTVGPRAEDQLEDIYEQLRLLISGFSGFMGQTEIYGLTIEFGTGTQKFPPRNESRYWTFNRTMGIRITHVQERTTWPETA